MYGAQTLVRAQILRYISRPKYTRQSPDCPLVIFSFTALPSCLHCSTSYSSVFVQHSTVAPPTLTSSRTRVHSHRLYYPRVSPSASVSLLQVRPLPAISSESQHQLALLFHGIRQIHLCRQPPKNTHLQARSYDTYGLTTALFTKDLMNIKCGIQFTHELNAGSA